MPVIERSAAILEPCSLHKTLTTVRTARQLHAAFWRNGATELELLSSGQMLPGHTPSTPSDAGPGRPDGPMMASILPFDFLYPHSSAGLLQRLYASPITGVWEQSDRLRRPHASGRLDARAYSMQANQKTSVDSTSSDKQQETKGQDDSRQQTVAEDKSQNVMDNDDAFFDYFMSKAGVPKDARHATKGRTKQTSNPEWFKEYEEAQAAASELSQNHQSAQLAAKNPAPQPERKPTTNQTHDNNYTTVAYERVVLGRRNPVAVDKRHVKQALAEKKKTGVLQAAVKADLESTTYGANPRPAKHGTEPGMQVSQDRLDRLWEEFQNLSLEEQHARVPELVLDLSQSKRLADNWRITQIFPLIRKNIHETAKGDRQTAAHVRAAIRAHYALHDSATGMKIYESWINERRRPVGFECPAAELIKVSDWPRLANLWQQFLTHYYKPNNEPQNNPTKVLRRDRRGVIQREVEIEKTEEEYMRAVPGFKDKILQLYDYVHDDKTPRNQRRLLKSFLFITLRWVLPQLKPRDAFRMVSDTQDPRLYEDFIHICINRRQLALATQAYLTYRMLPGPGPIFPVLRLLTKEIFLPERDVQKMELVMQDWRRGDLWLSFTDYKEFLTLYASEGDVASFERIYKIIAKEFPNSLWGVVSEILNLYRARGDTAMVRRLFNGIESRYKRKPKVMHWNVLLGTYNRDHDAALEIFADLCEAVEPNEASFTTIIKIMGRRGDIQLVRELHQMALDRGVKMTARSREGLIDALCLNDRYDEAEVTCKEETLKSRDKESRAKTIALWNRLLRHYAVRRDLVSIHRILNVMGDMNVGYSPGTYYYTLMALAYTRQVHHGLHLIRAGQVDGFFKPNRRHFLLLMGGFIRNGELHMVAKVEELMTAAGIPPSSSTTVRSILALLEAEKQDFRSPDGKLLSEDNFSQALRTFANYLRERKSGGQDQSPKFNPRDIGSLPKDLFSSLLFYAVVIRQNKTAADRLLEVYRNEFAAREGSVQLSDVRMLVSILNYEAFQRNFDEVMAIWETLFEMACEAGLSATADLADASNQRSASGHIVPTWKFVLADSLKTMQRLFEARGDASALKALFKRVRAAGFELTGPNWNHYIQGLARLGEWREAFTLCERVLMPQWRGWALMEGRKHAVKSKLPLEVRRMGTRLDYRRPTSYTILELGRHYRELINLGPWSREADDLLRYIRAQCPTLISAIGSYVGTSNPGEQMILGGEATERIKSQWKARQSQFKVKKNPGSDVREVALLNGLFAQEAAKDNKDAAQNASNATDSTGEVPTQEHDPFERLLGSVTVKKPKAKKMRAQF